MSLVLEFYPAFALLTYLPGCPNNFPANHREPQKGDTFICRFLASDTLKYKRVGVALIEEPSGCFLGWLRRSEEDRVRRQIYMAEKEAEEREAAEWEAAEKEVVAKEGNLKDEPVKEEPVKEEMGKEEPVKQETVKEETVKQEIGKEETVKEETGKEYKGQNFVRGMFVITRPFFWLEGGGQCCHGVVDVDLKTTQHGTTR